MRFTKRTISTLLTAAGLATMQLAAFSASAVDFLSPEDCAAGVQIDDKGMYAWAANGKDYGILLQEGSTSDELSLVTDSGQQAFQFEPRSEGDPEETRKQIVDILETYYPVCAYPWLAPDYPDSPDAWVDYSAGFVFVYDYTEEGLTEEKATEIMQALAQKQLISSFHSYTKLLLSQTIVWDYGIPTQYMAWDVDEAALQAYLDAGDLPCTILHKGIDTINGELIDRDADLFVVPNEKLSLREHIALAVELYEALGISPLSVIFESAEPLPTANALESAGDVNVNTTLEIGDAILLSRIVAEDATASVCDTGMINADVNADGMTSGEDVTALLRQLANLD